MFTFVSRANMNMVLAHTEWRWTDIAKCIVDSQKKFISNYWNLVEKNIYDFLSFSG